MQKDSIFRIYSMTKPITGVAMMMLYEEGKWQADRSDLALHPRVQGSEGLHRRGPDGKPTLEAPDACADDGRADVAHRRLHLRLLRHHAGRQDVSGRRTRSRPSSLQEFINKMATLPLLYQPGEGWVYSVSVDIQGYLVEKLSGKSFPEFLRERIFEPLGMNDTAFFVPESKLPRLATIYAWTAPGASGADAARSGRQQDARTAFGRRRSVFDCGRLLALRADVAQRRRARWCAPARTEHRRADAHQSRARSREANGKFGIGIYRMQPGLGFGYDFAISKIRSKLGSTARQGHVSAGTASPARGSGSIRPTTSLFIGMIQRWATAAGDAEHRGPVARTDDASADRSGEIASGIAFRSTADGAIRPPSFIIFRISVRTSSRRARLIRHDVRRRADVLATLHEPRQLRPLVERVGHEQRRGSSSRCRRRPRCPPRRTRSIRRRGPLHPRQPAPSVMRPGRQYAACTFASNEPICEP